MTTYCRDCDNVHPDTRGERPWKWVCLKVPVRPGYGFVDPEFSPDPPYARCITTNTTGDCPMFEKRREPEKAA